VKFVRATALNCSPLQQTIGAWRTVFYIGAAVYVFGTVVYGLLGSGEVQPWAMLPKKTDEQAEQELEHLKDNKDKDQEKEKPNEREMVEVA